MNKLVLPLLCSTILLAACSDDPAADMAEDRMENAAEASALESGATIVALGLTERQLLDAELIGPNDVELGDVESVLRGADGQVDRLIVEIEDSDPDRFVEVPIAGLTIVVRGNDTDLSTTMTREQVAALPDAVLPTP